MLQKTLIPRWIGNHGMFKHKINSGGVVIRARFHEQCIRVISSPLGVWATSGSVASTDL